MGSIAVSARIVMYGNNILMSSSNGRNLLDVGGNDGKRAQEMYPSYRIRVVDIKVGWDVLLKGLPSGNWDVILANHFIEHFIDPDVFLRECKRVMQPHTLLDIGTPNLAAWFNRATFLFGYLPHSYELSYEHNIGRPFNWNNEPLGGHLRVFTVPALVQLLRIHKFKIRSIEGEYSTYPCNRLLRYLDRVMTNISPSLASAFRIKCTL